MTKKIILPVIFASILVAGCSKSVPTAEELKNDEALLEELMTECGEMSKKEIEADETCQVVIKVATGSFMNGLMGLGKQL